MKTYVYRIDGAIVPKNEWDERLRATQIVETHIGWRMWGYTGSGKVLFECKNCGRHSPTPDKVCQVGSRETGDRQFSCTLEDINEVKVT